MDEQQRNAGVPLSVFISYAHEDEPLRQRLEAHLSLLRRQGLIADWHDRQILAGDEWARDIDEHLEMAQLVLLLISPDFLASDYCYGIEMRRALERHKNGGVQVIPILLRPVDWEGAPFAHLQCLPRNARAVTEWDNRDAAFRDIARGIRAAIEQLPSTATQPQPMPAASVAPAIMSTRAPAEPTDRNHQRMLKRVRATWIAGVLEQSLHGAALMVLGLEEKADVLDNPWRLLMQEVDRPAQPLPEGTRIIEIYNATEGGLLILGEPGAGKTTMMLELAQDLLDRAQTSENAPIPVVFNLSSWAKKRLSLDNWLVEELGIRYEVPRRLGQSWVSEDRLMLLLDGLDEVASAARKECIEAINSYRQTHPDVQVVVCSRSTEYLTQPTQLRLQTAVVVQPLTQKQINTYLESAGEQAEALREALRQDADLLELATTPLMLTILLFAYKGTSPDRIRELTSLEAKREQIFASYVQHMLKRRGASKRYKPERVIHWLTYLGRQMKRQNQSVFYLEQMQPEWLLKVWPRSFYRVLAGGVSGGLLCGLIGAAIGVILSSIYVFGTSSSAITAGLVIGLIIGQILGSLIGLLRSKSTGISTVEVITWSWANVRQAAIASIIGGPLGVLILYHSGSSISNFFSHLLFALYTPFYGFLYLLSVVVFLLIFLILLIVPECICFILIYLYAHRNLNGHRSIISRQRIWYAARRGALIGIFMVCIGLTLLLLTIIVTSRLVGLTGIHIDIYLVAIGCVSGLLTGLVFGASHRQLETHASIKPNQGIWRSLFNGARVFLIVGLIVWLAYDLTVIALFRLTVSQLPPRERIDFPSQQLLSGVIAGISIGLFFGLLNGGIACIKHMLLRVFLWRAGAMPWNYVRFLDYAAERILLRKVGGGYIFVHRLLLEYFVSLAAPFPEEAPAVAVVRNTPPVLSSTPQIDTIPREEKASLPVPVRKMGFNKEKRIVVLFVVVLLLEFSCGASIFDIVLGSSRVVSGSSSFRSSSGSTGIAFSSSTGIATAQVEANATAESVANTSPIVYPPPSQSPVLNDPLQDNSKGNNWEVDNPSNGNCKFINRAYDINTNQPEWCLAMGTDFTNFIFEVQMKIGKGDIGGIAFRIDPRVDLYQYYYFAISRNGSYSVLAHTGRNDTVLTLGSSSAIHRELNQTNLVAAIVHGTIIELYVNHQRVAVVGSSTYTHGRIGVIVTGSSDNQTEVIFQNAKVWKL